MKTRWNVDTDEGHGHGGEGSGQDDDDDDGVDVVVVRSWHPVQPKLLLKMTTLNQWQWGQEMLNFNSIVNDLHKNEQLFQVPTMSG